jgi:hypothetical protein
MFGGISTVEIDENMFGGTLTVEIDETMFGGTSTVEIDQTMFGGTPLRVYGGTHLSLHRTRPKRRGRGGKTMGGIRYPHPRRSSSDDRLAAKLLTAHSL